MVFFRKLSAQEVTATEPDEATVVSDAANYTGEKASHILVADEATANAICDRINAAADKDAQFKTELSATQDTGDSAIADSDGNLGWTSVNYSVYLTKLSNIYTALGSMSKGDCQVVQQDDGYHVVYCTDTFAVTDATTLTKDQIPAEIYDYVYSQEEESAFSSASSTYIQGLLDDADLQINDMPSGLSYDVDMSLAQSSSSSTGTSTTSGTTSDTSASSDTTSSNVSNTVFYQDDQGTYYYDESGNKVYLQISDDSGSTTATTTATGTGE